MADSPELPSQVDAAEPPPGGAPYPAELAASLAKASAQRIEPPRTRHLLASGRARFTNRLALESSPYLLQHSHNPVDWRPWGSEAFEAARQEGKPVFLSVGYSTCHWCHVMEEESFEDLAIAQLMNERFVCIKVDREERPDVDAVYMQAVQLLTQHGGWPMSVFLTPDRKPFFGGTYFPPRDGERGSRLGFASVLVELSRVYREERPRADGAAEQITAAVQRALSSERPGASKSLPGAEVLDEALAYYTQNFDPREGGLSRAPKFPSSLSSRFLLRAWKRSRGSEKAPLEMATLTLRKMALGGIYDQVGGGFHRYSTDAQWLVPHFEKMLYDNALLVPAYLEAFQATGEPFFRAVAVDVLDYLVREMTSPGGGFFSATDADSEGEEGTFFVWTPGQLAEVLGADDGARAARLYQATAGGNFEGKNILHLAAIPGADASGADDRAFLARVRPLLRAARATRPPPLTDRKILTSWNGLAISAFARAGLALGRPDYVACASQAADYLLETNSAGGVLLRSSMDGVASRHLGLLEDHAFLAAGLVDLFEASGDERFLAQARTLHAALEARFADPAGGYFRTPSEGEALLAREKPGYDGAEPTGNSTAALTLLRLEAITGEAAYRKQAEALLASFGAVLAGSPGALGEMMLAVDFLLAETREVVLVRPRGAEGSADASLLERVRARFAPWQVLLRAEEGAGFSPLVSERPAQGGRATAYVCVRGACLLPVTEPAALDGLLG